MAANPLPTRGEIWFAHLPTDGAAKPPRPVIIVSVDSRNRHERADTVLVVPLTMTIHKENAASVFLAAGETGLSDDCAARPDNLTMIRKTDLLEPRQALRRVSDRRICEIAAKLRLAVGC